MKITKYPVTINLILEPWDQIVEHREITGMFHDAYPKFGSKGRSSRLFSHISSNLIWTLPFQQRRQKVWGTVWEETVLVIGHVLPQAISWALVASNYWNSALCYQSPVGRTPRQTS